MSAGLPAFIQHGIKTRPFEHLNLRTTYQRLFEKDCRFGYFRFQPEGNTDIPHGNDRKEHRIDSRQFVRGAPDFLTDGFQRRIFIGRECPVRQSESVFRIENDDFVFLEDGEEIDMGKCGRKTGKRQCVPGKRVFPENLFDRGAFHQFKVAVPGKFRRHQSGQERIADDRQLFRRVRRKDEAAA
ncbi:MAG: hypothetical protein BWY31_03727 [Lentisphaerae bacterium ADurb.Bin242]|nr:MAG: hypothetical protein BWY31_03727 [Lentisphaerae bacterium ADurb.Bin242]